MAWTAPRTWIAGAVLTAAQLNVDVRDNAGELRVGGLALASQAAGDVVYASSASQLARLAADSGKILKSGAGAPSWVSLLTEMLAVDGAGSGLDADLLDGQSSAYYLAASAYTAADVLAKMLTVDGAGSGLDADLLDGYNSAESGASKILRTSGTGQLLLDDWVRQASASGIYNSGGAYWYHYSAASAYWYLYSGSASAASVRMFTANGAAGVGGLYGDTSHIGLINAGASWTMRMPTSGSYGSMDVFGSVSGYCGIRLYDSYGGGVTLMGSTGSWYAGLYNSYAGRWSFYNDSSNTERVNGSGGGLKLDTDWFRSQATGVGWYSSAHSVGVYASDTTWLRAYPDGTAYFRAQYLYSDALGAYAACGSGVAGGLAYWTGTYAVAAVYEPASIWFSSTFEVAGARTNYVGPISTLDSPQTVNRFYCPMGAKVRRLYVTCAAGGPGSGETLSFTVYKNGGSTALTCTISGTNTTANDTTNSFSVVAGDYIYVVVTKSSGAPYSLQHAVSMQLDIST